jgi:predicted glycosyltransferase
VRSVRARKISTLVLLEMLKSSHKTADELEELFISEPNGYPQNEEYAIK